MAEIKVMIFYFVFNLVYLIFAEDKPCPQIETIKNFDLAAYSGRYWYEIARYPNNIEKKGDCATMISYNDNGVYKFNTTEIIDGNLLVLHGFATNDEKQPGIIYLHSPNFKNDEVNNKFPVKILEADYDNFYFAYDCRYDDATKTRHEYAWVFARSRKLEGKSKKEFEEVMKSHSYIDINKLVWEHFSDNDCKTKLKKS